MRQGARIPAAQAHLSTAPLGSQSPNTVERAETTEPRQSTRSVPVRPQTRPRAALLEDAECGPPLAARGAPFARVYTFGAFRLLLAQNNQRWLDLTDTRLWGHGRAQDLLLLLLLRRRPIARVEAAATLWPDADPSRRARLLRNALWNLRHALEAQSSEQLAGGATPCACLELREAPHTLHLHAARIEDNQRAFETSVWGGSVHRESSETGEAVIWTDVEAFETACQQARAAETLDERLRFAQQALHLYAGPFLQHRQDASWISAYRTRLHNRWVHLTLDLATDWRRSGQRDLAIELLQTVLLQDPEQVEVAKRVLVLLREAGRVRDALDLYERFRRTYRNLFGADPLELKRLATEIARGA